MFGISVLCQMQKIARNVKCERRMLDGEIKELRLIFFLFWTKASKSQFRCQVILQSKNNEIHVGSNF